jgi:glycosyltransferase involved in cell wall biosynthesis
MIKIVQIQFSNMSAGSSAHRLHAGFSESSTLDSSGVSLCRDHVSHTDFIYLNKFARLKALINCKIENIKYKYDSRKFGLFSYPILGTNISTIKNIQDSDAIYIHWVQMGFLNFESFESLFTLNKKIFFVLHDMWFMTGGCHYSMDCKLFTENCQSCPIFPNDPSIAASQHSTKTRLISKYGHRLIFITPSNWLKSLALNSSLLKNHNIQFIPNYFKSVNFRKGSKSESREIFSIDSDKKVICFGAVNISSVYKGWKFLKDAFRYLNEMYPYDAVEVVIFGNGNLVEFQNSIKFKIHYLGFLDDEELIAHVYKCSDVFVIPSILDNQPTTIVESMNCGVPVVGFDLCGIPEMIEHKTTGYIAEAYNSKDLANGIHYCLENVLDVKLKDEYKPENVLLAHYNLLKLDAIDL